MRRNCSATPYTQMYGIALHLARVVLYAESILLQCFNDTYNMLYLQFTKTSYVYCMINIIHTTHYTVHVMEYTLYKIQYTGILTKCHYVNGVLRMQQKCYMDVTKVLQRRNMV